MGLTVRLSPPSLLCNPSPPTWHLSLNPPTPSSPDQDTRLFLISSQPHPKIQPVLPSLSPCSHQVLPPSWETSRVSSSSPLRSCPAHFMRRIPHPCLSVSSKEQFPTPSDVWDPKSPLLSLVLYGLALESPSPTTPKDSPHPAVSSQLAPPVLPSDAPKPLKIPEFQLDTDASSKTDFLVCHG